MPKTARSPLNSTAKKYRRSRSRSKSRTKTPEIETSLRGAIDMTMMMQNELRLTFPELTFEISPAQYDEFNKTHYNLIHGLVCGNKEICECFAIRIYHEPDIYIHVDRIKYKYGSECSLSGTYIITKLTDLFKRHQFPHVQMYDSAKIHITVDGEPREINLFLYHILLTGESWYNKYGYRSDYYTDERKKNEEFVNKPIPPQLKKTLNAELEGIYTIPKGMTFRDFAIKIDSVRRDEFATPEQKNIFMRAYFIIEEYILDTKKIKYNTRLKLRYE